MPKDSTNKAQDSIQHQLTHFAISLAYEAIAPEAVHAAKLRIIDTLGALIGGFFAEPCAIARNLAAMMPDQAGATVIGTRIKTTVEMAAFSNAAAARYLEMNDLYQWPGAFGGHTSDTISPVLAVAEHVHASGRDFITGMVAAYEVYTRISDVFKNMGFDHVNLCTLGSAIGCGKVLGLNAEQMAHCISMAVVPNNALRVTRNGTLSMWKVTASAQAARAGVFAALLARAGMEGPHLPFEGKAGWCDHIALERFTLPAMGGSHFKVMDTSIKLRPSSGVLIASIVAAEKIAPLGAIADVSEITVAVYKKARDLSANGPHHWNPDSKDAADHSVPYVVAAALMDGTVTTRSFNDAHLSHPDLHALMQKIKVVVNDEFTRAYESMPVRHRARVSVTLRNGKRLVGEAAGGKEDLSPDKSDDQIDRKFLSLTEDVFDSGRAKRLLEHLWRLDELDDVATIPGLFIFA